MIYIPWTFLEIAIQGHLLWGFSCSCIKMPRKRSQMGLQISDCLVLVVSICSLFWCTLPKHSGWKQRVSSPGSTGEALAVAELNVRCQMGLPSHLLTQLGEDPSAFCSAVWPRADLSSSRAAGRKASASSCGPLHGELPTGLLPSSEWSREMSQRQGRGREGEKGVGGG